VVGAQLFLLRRLAGHQRTTGAALAAAAWAASWAVVIAGGHLGGGAAAGIAFAAAMVIFALGECLISPTLPAIINDLAPPQAAGRYNGLGVLAFTTGFLLGPAAGGAALGAGWGTGLFAVLIIICVAAAASAIRLGRHLPAAANHIPAPTPSPAGPAAAASPQPTPGRAGPQHVCRLLQPPAGRPGQTGAARPGARSSSAAGDGDRHGLSLPVGDMPGWSR
jgi:MFS family permease